MTAWQWRKPTLDFAARHRLADSAVTALAIVGFLGACFVQIYHAPKLGHDSWQMTEWLINYAGGFVRRGLAGEAILKLSAMWGIQANLLAIAISFIALLVLLIFFIAQSGRHFHIALVLSPVLMGAPAYQDSIVRKDVFGLVILLACLAILRNKWPGAIKIVAVNALSIIGILSHEAYFFYAIPALIVFDAMLPATPSMLVKRIAWSALKLFPCAIAFFACVVFHGDAAQAISINNSLLSLWTRIQPLACCLDKPAAAIDSLQWDAARAVELGRSVLGHFSAGIYVPLAWFLTLCGCFACMVGMLRDGSRKAHLLGILIAQLIFVSPLFVVGWDFGRWIFLWTTSSAMIFIMGQHVCVPPRNWGTSRVGLRWASLVSHWNMAPAWLLVFGIPNCCWTVATYWSVTPVGFMMKRLVH